MSTRSKRKGNKLERFVAKAILAIGKPYGFKPIDCYRTPQSGGHRVASQKDPGDLQFSTKLARLIPFSIECKNQKKFNLEHFLINEKHRKASWLEFKWLAQTVKASTKKKAPMLICKSPSKELFLFARLDDYERWGGKTSMSSNHLMFQYNMEIWVGLPFSWFELTLSSVMKIHFAGKASDNLTKKGKRRASNERVPSRGKPSAAKSRRKVRASSRS